LIKLEIKLAVLEITRLRLKGFKLATKDRKEPRMIKQNQVIDIFLLDFVLSKVIVCGIPETTQIIEIITPSILLIYIFKIF
jgi:hypothetical protein